MLSPEAVEQIRQVATEQAATDGRVLASKVHTLLAARGLRMSLSTCAGYLHRLPGLAPARPGRPPLKKPTAVAESQPG